MLAEISSFAGIPEPCRCPDVVALEDQFAPPIAPGADLDEVALNPQPLRPREAFRLGR